MGIEIGGEIEKVNGKELSYNEFVERYLSKNQPVLLTGLMDDWRACKDWVTENGRPNLRFFSTHFGKSRVQIADCGTREFTDQRRIEMTVTEFINHWSEDFVSDCANGASREGSDKSVLYLKDWHFVKEYPDYVAYRTPVFFCDDWLNLYHDHYRMHKDPDISCQENNDISCSDYRFVYMGAKGSWTPLHADVFRSYSWSANVCGKKRWLLLSPSQNHLVFDRHALGISHPENLKNCVYNILDDVNETKFPGFKKAIWLECIQESNQIIFVPSGWYHQVHNLEDTVSINHNWFNAYNISWVWNLLLRDYEEAKEYIEDIRDISDDFESLCQRNLAANTGMNFIDFFVFLSRLFLANIGQLYYPNDENGSSSRISSSFSQHLALNLTSIQMISSKMKSMNLAGNDDFFVDWQEILDDPEFSMLCVDVGRTYQMIHKQQIETCDINKALIVDLIYYSPRIRTLKDFVIFIDTALTKLGISYAKTF
ncbi:hypothetical protein K2173_026985 [Erythroxylum novogranatense]|uniref:JmjC domain-containing protein n=1 Tax=Erythroxylum novogranatense TaxID=1862640 RepID=A0AAV8TY27_9ROSI|nr:hypothetical protein K2173_026985 [Erythroxylum novogranatense]